MSGISLYRSLPPDVYARAFLNSVPLMNLISHAIEDVIISNRLAVDLYVGFQRYSLFMRQQARYRALADVCRRIYIWGLPDATPPPMPGVSYIPLEPNAELAQEWFIVVDSPAFFTALMTSEVPPPENAHTVRRFKGVWTYDEQLIARAQLLLSQTLGTRYRPIEQRDYAAQNRFLVQISNRLVARYEQASQRVTRHRLLHNIITRGTTPVIVLDRNEQIIAVSDTAAALLRVAPEAFEDQTRSSFAAGLFAPLVLRDQAEPSAVVALEQPDGSTVGATSQALLDSAGVPAGWLISLSEPVAQRAALAEPTDTIAVMLQKQVQIRQLLGVLKAARLRSDVHQRAVQRLQQLIDELGEDLQQLGERRASTVRTSPVTNTNLHPPADFQLEVNRR